MEGAVGVREPVVVAAKADTARRADSTARIQQQSWTSRTTPQATAIGAPAIKAATAESTGRGCTRFVAARSPPPPPPFLTRDRDGVGAVLRIVLTTRLSCSRVVEANYLCLATGCVGSDIRPCGLMPCTRVCGDVTEAHDRCAITSTLRLNADAT
jgi:hypothetical protein